MSELRFDAIAPHVNPRTEMITELFEAFKEVQRHAAVNGIPDHAVSALAAAIWTEERRLRSISAEFNDLFGVTVKVQK